jgi:hypothetical protein
MSWRNPRSVLLRAKSLTINARARLNTIASVCIITYASITLLSLVVAHVLLVVHQQSNWAESIINPVSRGLQFVDAHWKSLLLLVGPFLLPVARDLIPRLRKAWGLEFDLPLEQVGKGQVPSGRGAAQ